MANVAAETVHWRKFGLFQGVLEPILTRRRVICEVTFPLVGGRLACRGFFYSFNT